ncbi:GGDEF domain-containing protein [Salinarimonas sp.]|uniref:putative bifunctional diguanylate cyclase/phosphodiesterase n=1 Tax=Salinarimonas sp. TaxID=2766526 RepID=UPI0032D98DDB
MDGLQDIQTEMLELVARGHPVRDIADRLCRRVEASDPAVICSVLTVEDGRLRPLAGPSLAPAYIEAIDGAPIGPAAGSCGTAAHTGEEVVVTDIASDPLWRDYSHHALAHGLLACWSRPILARDGRVLGTFALYYRERRGPSPSHRAAIERCVQLCSIAIEHDQLIAHNRRVALHDRLTGLPNRTAFEEDLAGLARRGPCAVGLLLVDVDGLKIVNDTLGHGAGDALIAGVADVLCDLGDGVRAYRIGGDEFAVLRTQGASAQALRSAASAVFTRLRRLGRDTDAFGTPRVTIGGAIGDDVHALRRDADLALYHAKGRRRGSYVLFREGMRTAISARLEAIREVGEALADGRIVTWFQPVARLEDARIIGVEALARLRRPDGSIATAGEFQAALDDPAIAVELTDATLRNVASTVRAWREAGVPVRSVGVNVTAFDLARGGFETRLARACARHDVPLDVIVIEVTENVVMRVGDRTVARTLAALRRCGVRIALDDFGTGFASLTHLLELPVDIIKMDRSFVAQMATDPRARVIVETLHAVARGLSLRVVAEGIETTEQLEDLRALGCEHGQGFLLGRPQPADRAGELMRRFGADPAPLPRAARARSAA